MKKSIKNTQVKANSNIEINPFDSLRSNPKAKGSGTDYGALALKALTRMSNSNKPCPFCGKEVEKGSKYFSLQNSGVSILIDRIAHSECGLANIPINEYKGNIYP